MDSHKNNSSQCVLFIGSSSPERRLSGNLLKHDLTPGSHASPLPPSKRQSKGKLSCALEKEVQFCAYIAHWGKKYSRAQILRIYSDPLIIWHQ